MGFLAADITLRFSCVARVPNAVAPGILFALQVEKKSNKYENHLHFQNFYLPILISYSGETKQLLSLFFISV